MTELKSYPNLKACYTVGQLITELQKLPPDLPIEHEFEEGVAPSVYNWKRDDRHLRFDEIDSVEEDDIEDGDE